MDIAVKTAVILPERTTLLGVADEVLAQRLSREIGRFAPGASVAVFATLRELREAAGRAPSEAIVIDFNLLGMAPFFEPIRELRAAAPVILLAPLEQQAALAPLVGAGDVEFVARLGDFVPLVAALIERKLRWAEMSKSVLGVSWTEFPDDIGSVFRHEINNPLTGILGNAELVLAHHDRLTSLDIQRLQIVVDLAVRLRETIRRLSDTWQNQPHSVKSA